MNIATDIKIDGKLITVYGHRVGDQLEFLCAEDENGDSVDLNFTATDLAIEALWNEVETLKSIYGGAPDDKHICERCGDRCEDHRRVHAGRMDPWDKFWSLRLCGACGVKLEEWARCGAKSVT